MKNAEWIRGARRYREQLMADPYRPGYHFAVPDDNGLPGDPNGCFYADGRHHLMYLYRREGGYFHWGHVSSHDLVHWRHHPDALVKGLRDEGCFSGGAFVDEDGTAYLSFWLFNDPGVQAVRRDAGIGLAKSRPPYDHWERLEGVAIESTSWGIRDVVDLDGTTRHLGCADPSNIWKAAGRYYLQTGNLVVLNEYGRAEDSPQAYRGDWTELFSSDDLRHWTHEGRFYQRRTDNSWTDESEDDMCPSFLPLPASPEGGAATDTYLQLFIAHNKGCQYYLGGYRENQFFPERHGRMSWVDNAFFAPEAYLDGRGRQIMFAWLQDNLKDDFERFGWSGVFSLPRTLWLREDGTLGIAPAQELAQLRMEGQCLEGGAVEGERPVAVKRPLSCELELRVEPGDWARAGLALHWDRRGTRATCIWWDARAGQLVMDASESGGEGESFVERAPLELKPGEALELTVYIDRSVIEVFANGRQAIARRVYALGGDVPTLCLMGEGGPVFSAVQAWEMMPSQPY